MTDEFCSAPDPRDPPADSTLLLFGERGCFSGSETAFRLHLDAAGRPTLYSGFRGSRHGVAQATRLEPGDEIVLADIIRLWTEAASIAPDSSTNHSNFQASGPLAGLFPRPFSTTSFSGGSRTACAWIQAVADGCPPVELCRRGAAEEVSGFFNPAKAVFPAALALWEQRQIAAASAQGQTPKPPSI